ncbi:MAG TPA: outer membrane beta-barrel protein [Ramlibacter sp.]|nr:outer membrane beta-barrel protein [Ramlibacter sp.]
MRKKLHITGRLAIATTASLIMVAPAAFAQDASNEEGLHVGARLGVEHDSNVLRQTSNGPSDTAWTAGLGLKYNKQFSLQRLRADVEWDTWRYSSHSELNFNTLNYNLAWDWSVTPRLHGTVSADRRQYREVVTDPVSATNLIGKRTERTELAEGAFDLGSALQLLAGASHYRAESNEPFSWDGLPDITYWQAGVGYQAASGSSAALRYKHGTGSYKDPTFASFATLNSDFKEQEVELSARWSYSGKTTVDGRISHVKREHNAAPQLDFSGMRGALNVNWNVTGKTRLQGGWMHDISASGLADGGHVDSDRFFISPVWQATAKTSFNARYDYTRREWKDISGASLFDVGRSDKIDSLGVGVDWQALRTILVSGYIRREKLRSSVNAGYTANVYGVKASYWY